MKLKALAVAAGASAPLFLVGSAPAGFVGIKTVSKPNPFGLFVVNVYAEFDRPGEDSMFAVSGSPLAPLSISVIDGTYFQHEFGVDRPPNPAVFDFAPSLRYDTFVTIGVKSFNPNDPGNPEGQPEDVMVFGANWPGFGPSELTSNDSPDLVAFWAVLKGDTQRDPFNSDFVAGDGRVLIMQLATEDGSGFEGTMIVNYFSNGDVHDQIVAFQHLAPDCPWDCGDGGGNGDVGITDFLKLLADWGLPSTCDFDGGGVGITDFLKLLAHWGLCP